MKKRWSYFIRKVYETDPLTCPKCQGEMRIIAFIDQPDLSLKKSLSTWVSGKSPKPGQTEKKKVLLLTPPTPSSFDSFLP
jgi:hypothetical protein